MEFCFNFLVDSNHSHNSNMVKDKYVKALDFMVSMKFTDSWSVMLAETSIHSKVIAWNDRSLQ